MIGETVSHFKILEKLGGGMSIVYKARDLKLDRLVALKFLPPYFDDLDFEHKRTARERFVQEAKAASALDHPHIGTIYEIDETEDGRTFIAMAFYEGATLKKAIEQGPKPVEEAVRIAIQVARGLSQAHASGILHRDIKPANIMLTRDGLAKVIDFGLARLKDVTRITERGAIIGTLAYMAPEQVRGEDLDERADIWALGVVLYEMLAGRRPFAGESEGSVIHSILNLDARPLRELRKDIPPPLERVVVKALQKNREGRFDSTAEMVEALEACRSLAPTELHPIGVLHHLRQGPLGRAVAVVALLLLATAAAWLFHRNSRIRWAREQAIPEIKRLADEEKSVAALKLALEAEGWIPTDPALRELLSEIATTISIETTPPGADVYGKDYLDVDSEWQPFGRSPIKAFRVPVGFFRWKIEKSGYGTVERAASTLASVLHFTLDEAGSIPSGMVRIPAGPPSWVFEIIYQTGTLEVPAFLIDKHEVTNREFKEFVDRGGYRNREYWKQSFIKAGHRLSWEDAIADFRDTTGRPGPATWEFGTYPGGQENYPVGGVSWYEAAAYAEFVGKALPTVLHWDRASLPSEECHRSNMVSSYVTRLSNFSGVGPRPVGSHQGISLDGAYDLAGNVREWTWNRDESLDGRAILGGGWSDAPYVFTYPFLLPSFDRSPENGFRCARYLGERGLHERFEKPLPPVSRIDFRHETPAPDAIFRVYRSLYAYDRRKLNAAVESVDESQEFWVREKITFDAAYGNERVMAYLFLPKNASPPYQPLIYFPGAHAVFERSSETLYMMSIDFLIRSGRAVLYPIYKSTYERGDGFINTPGDASTSYRDHVIMWAKDLSRSVDYLESREDIDLNRLTFFGLSWGAQMGPLLVAVENRIKAAVFEVGGLVPLETLPEAHPFHFAPRVTVPVLMLNGRHDYIFPMDKTVLPLLELLGTRDQDKRLIVYESGHSIPKNASIRDMLDWLDLRLGAPR